MRHGLAFTVFFALLVTTATGQEGAASSSSGDAFWVSFWAQPRVTFSPEEEAFYRSMKEVTFARNEWDRCLNPGVLNDDAEWIKGHANVRVYIDGYASSRGDLIYNLALSQRRADWVKQALVSRGVPEDRIRLAVGWGQLYPVCLEQTEECWNKNKLVRFMYAPVY